MPTSNPFEIVKDSSIWYSPKNFAAMQEKDPYLRLGVVQKSFLDEENGDVRYLVQIFDRNDKIQVNCRVLRRFGGVYNYEDEILRGYNTTDKPDPVDDFSAKAGDCVLVAFMNGEPREGVILGGMTHAARSMTIKPTDGPQYISEFNGVETSINKDGEYKLTFKGQPTNLARLADIPNAKIVAPKYNMDIGGSYWTFNKTGGWKVNDAAKENPQSIEIDKAGGTLTVTSGKVIIKITKASETINVTSKMLDIASTDKINATTKEFSVKAETAIKMNSAKIAIGQDGVELLDQIFQLVEKLGMVQPISPIGPCTPLMATPQWAQVKQVQSKVKQITGTF